MQLVSPSTTAYDRFARGQSYWRVVLRSGREVSELQHDWYRDIVASGDAAHIAELWICTPQGDAALKISEPYSAYQLQQGVLSPLYGRQTTAQIIGRIDDKERGQGIAFIWDVATQHLYRDEAACVRTFGAWRPGIVPLGMLATEVMGLRGVA
jgi:hypothetical protein